MSLRRQEARLAAIFQHALMLGTAGCWTVAQADSDASATKEDATVGMDATAVDAPSEAAADAGLCAKMPYDPQVMDLCADWFQLPCGLPDAHPRDNCYFPYDDCVRVCDGFFYNCLAIDDSCVDGSVVSGTDGGLKIECSWCVGGPGRAPEGLAVESFEPTLGGWLARAAHLEAASVHAFRRMQHELARLGAPKSFVRAAKRAERDEIRHARVTDGFARRLGGRSVRPRVRRVARRSVEAIAIENAVQGCVGETYAALEAAWQARHAPSEEVRTMMAPIARDEARHAALSWAVATFLESKLDAAALARLNERKKVAIEELRRQQVPAEVARAVGLPSARARRRLIACLDRSLWS